jgi:hypothetical protein
MPQADHCFFPFSVWAESDPVWKLAFLADWRSTFGAMAFKALDTCYTKNLTGARKDGSDSKSLKIKTSNECDPQLIPKAEQRVLLAG